MNKLEFAKKVFVQCNTSNSCEVCPVNNKQECLAWLDGVEDTIAEYLEEYKWHDLRKNPDDLPEDWGLVEVVEQETFKHYFAKHFSKWKNGESADVWVDEHGFHMVALAWRYIEQFEEE